MSPVTVGEMPLCLVDQVAVIGTGDQTGRRKCPEGSDDLGCGGVQLLFDAAALRCPEALDLGGDSSFSLRCAVNNMPCAF